MEGGDQGRWQDELMWCEGESKQESKLSPQKAENKTHHSHTVWPSAINEISRVTPVLTYTKSGAMQR